MHPICSTISPQDYARRPAVLLLVCQIGLTAGCVVPSTQLARISPSDLRPEEPKHQQQLVIRPEIGDQQRVEDVGYPLLEAALPICGPGATSTRAGVRYANVHTFTQQCQPPARALGVTELTPGRSAAQQASDAFDRARSLDPGLPIAVRTLEMEDAARLAATL